MTEKIIKSGGNVFSDLGFKPDEAMNLKLRSQLMMELENWIKQSNLTQSEVAKILNVHQSRISDLIRGKIDRFSIDMLVTLLEKTGKKVSIQVKSRAA